MTVWRKILIGLGLFVAGGWLWFQYTLPTATLRYRLTLEAEADGKPVTGSGVIEVKFGLNVDFMQKAFTQGLSQGEAVVLDLGSKGSLFALLASDKLAGGDAPFYLFADAFDLRGRISKHDRSSVLTFAATQGRRELSFDKLPLLVRFRDISDPKSIERVSPTNLGASFGPGVSLKRAFIETTTDPVTTGIEKRLVWLREFYDKRLDGQRFGSSEATNSLANYLASGSFKSMR